MAEQVGDVLLRRLGDWGVRQVFGYPGDGINGLLAAWAGGAHYPQFVQARHEEMAAFEAVGYAKFSGSVGVCAATGGPGAIHLLTGLYDAKLDHVPVVAIVGQTECSALGGSHQQEVDLPAAFKDVCSAYSQLCVVPQQLPNVLDRAFRVALAERAPTAVIVPADVFSLDYTAPAHEMKNVPSSLGLSQGIITPDPEALHRAAEILDAGERVAILVGQGARGCAEELTRLADLLGAGVAKALLGKDVLPDTEPWVTGSLGLLGTTASHYLMSEADTLLTIGSNFPYSEYLPEFGQVRGIQIDRSGAWIGMRYPYEVSIVADAKAALRELIPLVKRKRDRSWRKRVEHEVAQWWQAADEVAMLDADPINPMRIFSELSPQLPDNAVVTADSGTSADWYARHLRFHGDMRGSLSGTLASMGCAVPYAIGAKWACPERPAIALVGDGAMQMNGLAELITIARYWRQWQDPRLIVAVLHNNDLNQVTWELRGMHGAPKFPDSQTLPDVDYAAFARSLGLGAESIDDPEALARAWSRALSSARPVVLDIACDPNVAPIPPNTTFEQFSSLARALLHGDEDAGPVLAQSVKQKTRRFFARHRNS
ncbi:thiamine pyrophosphate-requiring protein [Nocardia cyriacigeorgica]|uniref:thiamine pyrophosphate-requiring protein n=1 Tax=Nocardia cyriacigeorgica TaxID=135487 RepID=UPI001894A238|nr:thiamine pyrophosphate-requiring protein [Nocardia cyriacigeorgica]MBF6345291.1 thiamine pyrophosphate-requiring protein [Nocardia cyriacigeorgica]